LSFPKPPPFGAASIPSPVRSVIGRGENAVIHVRRPELTFKGNRANRRPISFKDSAAFVSVGCFFVNSTQTRDVAKKSAAETNALKL
jgi:hypothetical protein